MVDDRPGFGDAAGVGVVVPPLLWQRSGQLREILTAGAVDSGYSYSWSVISAHLDACMLYVSWSEIVIRPIFPPSLTHQPFAAAKQRVYMSATLGNGGDLERATGVAKIRRLPPPAGWDKQGTGRRLIMLPDLSLRPEETAALTSQMLSRSGRALILTTDNRRAQAINASWLGVAQKEVLGAEDIEEDLGAFTTKANAALLLTNRYDGLDLPDDACRFMVIDDLPDATNLQERFLTQRLGANAFLRERMRTRITQALGRCTRNDRDFATVLLLGTRLASFVAQRDVLAALHPELQAELKFGLENSADQTVEGFSQLAQAFQGAEWVNVERYLQSTRNGLSRIDDPVAAPLRVTVADELAYVYAAWAGNWPEAHARARAVSDSLEGGVELRPYRGLWYALAGFTAVRADLGPGTANAVDDLLARAVACTPAWVWFFRPASITVPTFPNASSDDALSSMAAVRAADELVRLGTTGSRFDRTMNEVRTRLAARDARTFEMGLDALGALLGFDVTERDSKQKAAPDSVWFIPSSIAIAWEAKSNEEPDRPIPIRDVREANGHFDWVRDRLNLRGDDATTVVMASPRSTLDPEAKKYAGRLRYAHVSWVAHLAAEAISVLSAVRRAAGAAGEEVLRQEVLAALRKAKLTPTDIRERFKALDALP